MTTPIYTTITTGRAVPRRVHALMNIHLCSHSFNATLHGLRATSPLPIFYRPSQPNDLPSSNSVSTKKGAADRFPALVYYTLDDFGDIGLRADLPLRKQRKHREYLVPQHFVTRPNFDLMEGYCVCVFFFSILRSNSSAEVFQQLFCRNLQYHMVSR